MELNRKMPIGVELVRRKVVTEDQINQAIEFQKTHRKMKLGEILKDIADCDERVLIEAIADILGEKGVALKLNDIRINLEEYISLDIIKACKAIPFEIEQGKIKVCFSDMSNKNSVDRVKMLLLNKGLIMEKYITFDSNINSIIDSLEGKASDDIDMANDTLNAVDSNLSNIGDMIDFGDVSNLNLSPVLDMSKVNSDLNNFNREWNGVDFNALNSSIQNIDANVDFSTLQTATNNQSDLISDLLNQNQKLIDEIDAMRLDMAKYTEAINNSAIVMDTGLLVGAMTPDIDRALGQRQMLSDRGVF